MRLPLFTADLSSDGQYFSNRTVGTITLPIGELNASTQDDKVILAQRVCARSFAACYGYCSAQGNPLDCLGGCDADLAICKATGGEYHFAPA
jgi:hypothetical protein